VWDGAAEQEFKKNIVIHSNNKDTAWTRFLFGYPTSAKFALKNHESINALKNE
jgi:hypothetical protein